MERWQKAVLAGLLVIVGVAAVAAVWVTRPAPRLGLPVDWQAIYRERIAPGDCEKAAFVLSQIAAQDPEPFFEEEWRGEADRLRACASSRWDDMLRIIDQPEEFVHPRRRADLFGWAWEEWFDERLPLERTEHFIARARAAIATATCYLPHTHMHVRMSSRSGRNSALKSGGEIRRVLAGALDDPALLDQAYERDRLRCAERMYRAGVRHAETADRAGAFWVAHKYLGLADDMGHPLAPLARANLALDHPLLAYPSESWSAGQCPARDALGRDHAVPIAFDRYLFPLHGWRPQDQFKYSPVDTTAAQLAMIFEERPELLDPALSLYLYALGGKDAYGRLRSETYAPWEADAVVVQRAFEARLDRETRVLIANRIRARGFPQVCLREVPELPACPPVLDAGETWEEGNRNRIARIKPVEAPARPLYVDWRLEMLVWRTLKIGPPYDDQVCMIYVDRVGNSQTSSEFAELVREAVKGIPAAEEWLSSFR